MKNLIPNTSTVLTVSDIHQKEYRVIYNFDNNMQLKADFIGANKYGFWIGNAHVTNEYAIIRNK